MIYLTILDRLILFFSSLIGKIGTIVFGSTILMFSAFAFFADISEISFWFESTGTVTGIVRGSYATNTSINEQTVMGYYYDYMIEGLPYSGESFSHDEYFNENEEVTVVYLQSNPEISRIQGTMRATMPIWVLLIVGIFPSIGFIVFWIGVRSAAKTIHILSHGESGKAKLVSTKSTNTRINNRVQYLLKYEYNVQGTTYTNRTKSTFPEKYDDEEPVIYSQIDPSKSILKKSLPTRIAEKADLL